MPFARSTGLIPCASMRCSSARWSRQNLGIRQAFSGVHAFLKKLWKLYHSGEGGQFHLEEGEPGPEALKVLHKTIRKVEEDIEALSFNTTVSTFMICVNELTAMNCHARAILEPLVILVSPYAPHIAEELWQLMGNQPLGCPGAISRFR